MQKTARSGRLSGVSVTFGVRCKGKTAIMLPQLEGGRKALFARNFRFADWFPILQDSALKTLLAHVIAVTLGCAPREYDGM